MEYNIENIRTLAEKYFRGETTLAEEAALREYFNNSREIPADLEACRLLFRQNAIASAATAAADLMIKVDADPKLPAQRRRWVAAASGIAAAAAVLAVLFTTVDFNRSQTGGIVCYVNGHLVTDRQAAMEYTQETFDIINASLQKPAEYLSPSAESKNTMERLEKMLNALTSEE